MTLNEIRDKAFAYAEKQGLHYKKSLDFKERLTLVVFELSEALEADEKGKWCGNPDIGDGRKLLSQIPEDFGKGTGYFSNNVENSYKIYCRNTVEEELADVIIRIGNIAGRFGIDLDWHVKAKMAYNETRPYKHGKNY